MTKIKVGDTVPDVELKYLDTDGIKTISSHALFHQQKVLLIGVIGAFTPICSKQHLPDFVPFSTELKRNGLVDKTMCISVADPFALNAWAREVDPGGEINMLTDNNAMFAEKAGLTVDLSHMGLGIRSTRYAMLIDDKVVCMLTIEDAPQNFDKTTAISLAKHLDMASNDE
jgi:peroxiredoxin